MKKEIELHQHVDVNKVPFGKLHPVNAVHKNKKHKRHMINQK